MGRRNWRPVLVVLLAILGLSSFSWADISVHITPQEAVNAGAQWRVDGGAWLSSDETAAALPDGWRQVEFKALAGWTEPVVLNVFSVSGALHSETATYKALPHFNLGEIPPQTVWHGTSLKLYVHPTAGGSVSCTVDVVPAGTIVFDAGTGFFVYTPAGADKLPFTVTFNSAGNDPPSQAVLVSPMAHLLPEQAVFGAEPPSSTPVDETDIRIETKNNPSENFNHVNRVTQAVRIIGQVVVFQEGHENQLYDNYNGNPAIKNLEINARNVIIRGPLHLPQTNVTINANELRFEDGAAEAFIKTTPLDNPVASPPQSTDGTSGLKAGDIKLNISSLYAPAGPKRFLLVGGRGQDPGLGRNGVNGTTMQEAETWHHVSMAGYVWRIVYGERRYEDFFGADSWDYFGTKVWPTDGENAVQAGIAGNGGNGGNLISTIDAGTYADLSGGQPGTRDTTTYYGGAAGTPRYAVMVHEDDGFWYSSAGWYYIWADGWNYTWQDPYQGSVHARISSWGTNAYPRPAGSSGTAGTSTNQGDYLAWLNPVNTKNLLNQLKDSYLENNDPGLRKKLEEYVALIEAYKGRAAWNDLSMAEQLELQGMADEMQTLLHRIRNNLDYFGNPAGWVPMLSFEVNRTIFDNEIDRSIEILYLTYWLKNRAATLQQKVDALTEAREKIKAEIEDSKTRLGAATDLIPALEIQAGEISNEIFSVQQELEAIEHKLLEQAQENLKEPWWKTGLKIAGNICKVIPVGQPALGAIGGGMDLVANFNKDDPWSSILGAADICSTFASSKFDDASKELKKKVDQVETKAGAEQKALESAQSLKDWTGAISGGLTGIRNILAQTQVPQSAIEAELERLKAESEEFKEVSRKISGLMDKKMGFQQQLATAMQDVANLSNLITNDLLALDGMNRDVTMGDDVLDDRALMYLNDMERRARERLLKYHYYMAKAYEYRMLKAYDSELNLDDLFDQFIAIAELNIGSSEPYVLDADQFHSLKAIYEDKLAVVAQTIFEDYNSNPPELSVPIRFNLTQDELDRLNAGEPVKVNLMDIGLFLSSEENIRIVDFEVAAINAHLEGADFSRWANLNLYIEHSGVSNLEQSGKVLKFNHYNSSTTNPIVWGARYDWYDNLIDPIRPSAASDSLLRSLLESDMAQDMMLYSRPAAWANLVFRKEVNCDNGADVVIDSLRLKLTYDFMRKASAQSHLDVVVSENEITPYFIVDGKDMNQRQDGRGAFRRIYPRGQAVSIKAQDRYGRLRFKKWTDRYGYDISGQDASDPGRISLTLYTDQAIMAHYVSDEAEQFTITGEVKTAGGKGVGGVTITFSNDGGSVTTDSQGHYSQPVPYGWHGTATPSREGFTFTPSSRNFLPVVASRGSQNFVAGSIGSPSLASSKTVIDLGDVNASESFLVWNTGAGTAYYTVTVIEGNDWFSVTPASGSSVGIDDKKIHTVSADRSKIPAGETRTGTIEIWSDGAATPLYIHLSASNASIISLTKSTFKAGQGVYHDSFTLSGYFNPAVQQIASATSIIFKLWSPQGLIYEENLPFTVGDVHGDKYHYKREAAADGRGGITDFRFDLNRHAFSLKSREIDLTGLEAPVYVDLIIGDYNGLTEVPEHIINGGKPLPVTFMSGVADRLRVDTAVVKTNPMTGFDTLVIQGGISLESGVADLTGLPVTVTWGSQAFVIPSGQLKRRGQTNSYRVRLSSQGSLIIARFNLDSCEFKVTIRSVGITPKTGPITFGMTLGSFYETDVPTLP